MAQELLLTIKSGRYSCLDLKKRACQYCKATKVNSIRCILFDQPLVNRNGNSEGEVMRCLDCLNADVETFTITNTDYLILKSSCLK